MTIASVTIGLDKFHYAKLLTDTTTGVTYATPVLVSGIQEIGVKTNASIDTLYADDGPALNANSIGVQDLEIGMTSVDSATKVAWFGHTVDANGVIHEKITDTPAVVAVGFRSLKTNGKYRYVWYLKGQFSLSDESYKTKEDKTSFNTPKFSGKFLRRDFDQEYRVWVDEDDATVPASVIENWFNAVPVTTTSPDALTLATVPVDTATAVVISANLTATYNNVIQDNQLTDDYFYIMKADDGTKIASAITIDTAKKVVTINPDANLAAATPYILVVSGLVTDVYGQKLAAGTTLVNFTTA